MVKLLFTILCITLMQSCSTSNAQNSITQVQVTSITATGNDDGYSQFCEDFSLTKAQAQYFFDNAQKETTKSIHDHYSFLPCFVSGTAYLDNNICEWEIRAGGTGTLNCQNQTTEMACNDCLPLKN